MNKQTLIILILFSVIIRIGFAAYFPLIGDELNFWNYFYDYPVFSKFWEFFTLYDTQQPLFYLLWFPVFNPSLPQLAIRLPSIIIAIGSLYFWAKLFPYKNKDNLVPWLLFLFAPFLSIYSSLFLPYSLLVCFSLYNFYYFRKIEKYFTKTNVFHFALSCLLLTYTHYYGAMLAVAVCLFLFVQQKDPKIKRDFIVFTLVIFALLLVSSDFLNDFNAVHAYRKTPRILEVLGFFNLLIGGRYIVLILLAVIIARRKMVNLKNKYVLFTIAIIVIAFLKSIIFSPSIEARYLLILTYPIFYMTRGFQFKYATPLIVGTCLVSLYILQNAYGPAFVTDYSKIPRTTNKVGLLVTPCPRYYFREANYICKNNFAHAETFTKGLNEMIVHEVHLPFFKRLEPVHKCVSLGQDLYNCTYVTKR